MDFINILSGSREMDERLKELSVGQSTIEKNIVERARICGLSTKDLSPITDGVANFLGYLKWRIAVVLKEGYDDISSEDGKPMGGGWSINNDCFGAGETAMKNDCWSNRTWQALIYVLYGIMNDRHWEEMDWIRDDKSMANVLKNIAYLNVSKMPAYTSSDNCLVAKNYEIWKPILLQQFQLYDPRIVLFCGTYQFFEKDMEEFFHGKPVSIQHLSLDGYDYGNVYHCNDKLILAVDHTLCRSKGFRRKNYVNLIIESVLNFLNKK